MDDNMYTGEYIDISLLTQLDEFRRGFDFNAFKKVACGCGFEEYNKLSRANLLKYNNSKYVIYVTGSSGEVIWVNWSVDVIRKIINNKETPVLVIRTEDEFDNEKFYVYVIRTEDESDNEKSYVNKSPSKNTLKEKRIHISGIKTTDDMPEEAIAYKIKGYSLEINEPGIFDSIGDIADMLSKL